MCMTLSVTDTRIRIPVSYSPCVSFEGFRLHEGGCVTPMPNSSCKASARVRAVVRMKASYASESWIGYKCKGMCVNDCSRTTPTSTESREGEDVKAPVPEQMLVGTVVEREVVRRGEGEARTEEGSQMREGVVKQERELAKVLEKVVREEVERWTWAWVRGIMVMMRRRREGREDLMTTSESCLMGKGVSWTEARV